MKKRMARIGLVLAVGVGFAGTASAQTLEPTPTAAASVGSLGETSPLRLSLTLAPMPAGKFKSSFAGTDVEADTAFAFALAPTIDYSFNQFAFIGFTPQYIFNVKGKDSTGDAAKELDLLLRLGGNAKVADTIMLFGYLAPGYGIVMPSSGDSAKGFVIGFAAGALFDLTPGLFATGEIGYQLGYQSVKVGDLSVDFKTNFLRIGVGLGVRL